MKREGEEGGEELKLLGKERNRVGLNLPDCFQLHASSRALSLSLSLSLSISFFPFLLLSWTPFSSTLFFLSFSLDPSLR